MDVSDVPSRGRDDYPKESMHNLLKRQLKQYFGKESFPDELKPFMESVSKAYSDFEVDRNMLERSLEYSSQELVQANSDMQAIFQTLPDVFLKVDLDGNIIEHKGGNKEDLMLSSGGLVGKRIQDVLGQGGRYNFIKGIEEMKRSQSMVNLEYSVPLNGEEKFFEARLLPLNKKEAIIVIRNISDRKKTEGDLRKKEMALRNMLIDLKKVHDDLKSTQTQLLQSEKLASIGQLAAGVAHEINNPVGFINNNMEVLEQYITDYGKVLRMVESLKAAIEEENLQKAKTLVQQMTQFEKEINLDYIISDINNLLQHNQRGIERIRKIVLDLRTFAREEKDTMDFIRIEEVIDSILSIVHNELKYKAELKKHYGETPSIKCSSQRLGQVFINLFVNAVQAIEEKGTIEVKTYTQGNYVCVDVADTGKGIEEKNLKRIFDPFFTTKPIGEGTGLGLSVSYEIMKKHGGEIKVKTKLGEGTTFTVMLPIT